MPRGLPAITRGLDDSMAADDPMARQYKQRFLQQLEDVMTQWLEDDQLDALRPEVSASARGLDGAIQRSPHQGLDNAMVIMQWLDVTMTRWHRKLRCR